jgi:hypothetical protein
MYLTLIHLTTCSGIWDAPKPVPGAETESLTKVAEKLMKRMRGEATTDKQKVEQHNTGIETKKKALDITRQARSRRIGKQGITGNRNS